MSATQLNWYPPAPAEAPRGFSRFHPDDWALEPKLDGIRVIWWNGQPWTRQGKILAPSKGAESIRKLCAGIDQTIDGEWIAAWQAFYCFDLPDHSGAWDERREALRQLADSNFNMMWCVERLGLAACGFGCMVAWVGDFDNIAARFKELGHEGYVLKRRNSLYPKMTRPGAETRDWLKRRFRWDA